MIILWSISDGLGFFILRRKNDEGRLTKEDVDEKFSNSRPSWRFHFDAA